MNQAPPAPPETSGRALGLQFNLMRWFSLTALLSVAAVSALSAYALSNFLTERMIRQEAEITASFVRNVVDSENAYIHFEASSKVSSTHVGDFAAHLAKLPDAVRINVYSSDRVVIWSSDATLIGKHFGENDELDEALRAELVVHSGIVDSTHLPKSEHVHLGRSARKFVESYIPILAKDQSRVVGVVELYKVPRELFEAIHDGIRLIWFAAAGAGLFLYATLFWIVRRAHRIIERQGEQLIESESLAVVGEMGSAVAHGLRNPLASIRSSAELALEGDLPPQARECATDVVAQVDRLEGWVRQLLTYAKPSHAHVEPVDINAVLTETLATYQRELDRRDIRADLSLANDLPLVRGEPAMLVQILGSLIANAMEALQGAGIISVISRLEEAGERVLVEVKDSGPGMSREAVSKVFKPFYTSKAKGLGLGLPLVLRVVERFGGNVVLESQPGVGTTVRVFLRTFA